MKSFQRPLSLGALLLLLLVSASLTGCGKSEDPATTGGKNGQTTAPARKSLAVIPKGTQHSFWKSVESGARKAGQEFNVEVIWKGPLQESDRAGQIQLVQQFVTQGVDGIALAPLDQKALVGPVRSAGAAKIPVVIFDSALEGESGKDFISFVATNNRNGGKLAGEQMVKLLGGKGKVVLLRYQVGSASTTEREEGFLEVIRQHPDIQLLVDNRYAGASAAEAKNESLNILDSLKQADGVYCPNESSTQGMLLALRQEGLAGKIKFVGFDASQVLVQALKDGEIQALVVQNPVKMGYEAVKALAAALNGSPVEPVIDTGAALVTLENLQDPSVQELIQ
jgi:ribose transport system substrate-binding protein